MSKFEFDQAFAHVVDLEGGYVNDPNDPGGETNFGISKRAYPNEDIKNMSLMRAKVLYKRDYWDVLSCDKLPFPLNLFVFDAGVNQGVSAAATMLQRMVNVNVDAVIGPKTLQAVDVWIGRNTLDQMCAEYMSARAMRYVSTERSNNFLRGWFNRLFKLSLAI